jgi:hypothetical protein
MSTEFAPYGIQVMTLNPEPYGTGFNHPMIVSWRRWYDRVRNFTQPDTPAVTGRGVPGA